MRGRGEVEMTPKRALLLLPFVFVLVMVLLSEAERASAGCNPNLVPNDRYPSWGGSAIAFQRQTVACDPPPDLVMAARTDGSRLKSYGVGAFPAMSRSDNLSAAFGGTIRTGAAFGPLQSLTPGSLPAFSPDGQRIAFVQGGSLWVAPARPGSLSTKLAEVASFFPFSQAHVATPAWSPDGTRIAYVGPGVKIWVATADGSVPPRQVSDGFGKDAAPSWSADSARIAFMTDRAGNWDIYRVNADGSGLYGMVTDGAVRPNDQTLPAWSPDGSTLAFVSSAVDDYGKGTLQLIGPAGGPSGAVVAADLNAFSTPSWSPDGKAIAYAAGRECKRWGIYVYDLAKRAETRISNTCEFFGTGRADVLRGTPYVDFLHPGKGRDRVYAGAGNDRIFASDGERDSIDCGPGKDTVLADRLDVVAANCEQVRR
jgi:dipeptidyl aminopeptidase/acylaminoacyl peptidase